MIVTQCHIRSCSAWRSDATLTFGMARIKPVAYTVQKESASERVEITRDTIKNGDFLSVAR